MPSFLGNKAKDITDLSDEVLAKNMLASASSTSNAYLNALMTSSTPEVRAVYAASLNQIIGGHSALTELALKRNWTNPYIEPREQMSTVYSKVQSVIQQNQ